MKVLVISEDFRNDQYMLQPIITAMLHNLNIRNLKVLICRDPLIGGVTEALKWSRIKEIIDKYAWQIDLFLLCVDRDGEENRFRQLTNLEQEAAQHYPLIRSRCPEDIAHLEIRIQNR